MLTDKTSTNVIGGNVLIKNAELGNFNTINGNVILEDGVKIGNNCTISGNITIGANTQIYNNVTIVNNVVIGKDNILYAGVSIGQPAQHLVKYDLKDKNILIGDHNIIRENVTINMPYTKDSTVVKDHCYLMGNTNVAHDAVLGNNVIMSVNASIGGYTQIEEYGYIGLNACIHQYCRIGKFAMIGMGSAITKDVLPFHTCAGSGNQVKLKINEVGFVRNFKGDIHLDELLKARALITKNQSLKGCSTNEVLCGIFDEFEEYSTRGVYYG